MTNDERALIAAIIASPRDYALRLICADWYEDHGQETWANLIRWQIQIEALTCPMAEAKAAGRQHINGPCRCERCSLVHYPPTPGR